MLKERVKSKLLDLRQLEYYLEQLQEEPEEIKGDVEFIMISSNHVLRQQALDRVKEVLKRKLDKDKSVKELKEIAQQMGVPGYSRMGRTELLNATVSVRRSPNFSDESRT